MKYLFFLILLSNVHLNFDIPQNKILINKEKSSFSQYFSDLFSFSYSFTENEYDSNFSFNVPSDHKSCDVGYSQNYIPECVTECECNEHDTGEQCKKCCKYFENYCYILPPKINCSSPPEIMSVNQQKLWDKCSDTKPLGKCKLFCKPNSRMYEGRYAECDSYGFWRESLPYCKCKNGYGRVNGECEMCQGGFYSDKNTDVCLSCDSNSVSHSKAKECTQCSPGSHKHNTTHCACDEGYGVDGNFCVLCNAGEFSMGEFESCMSCGENEISTEGSSSCQTCTMTGMRANKDHTECECAPGFGLNGRVCVLCGNKQYSIGGNNKCMDCNENEYATPGSDRCYTALLSDRKVVNEAGNGYHCIPGTEPKDSYCSKCPSNMFSPGNNVKCEECPVNMKPNSDSTQCECNAGFYKKQDICTPCEPGTFSLGGNVIECQQCASNTVSSAQASSCSSCSNKKEPSNDQSSCVCKAGFGVINGDSDCSKCEAGYFSPGGNNECQACPDGTVSKSKSSSCKTCSEGNVPNEDSSECVTPCNKALNILFSDEKNSEACKGYLPGDKCNVVCPNGSYSEKFVVCGKNGEWIITKDRCDCDVGYEPRDGACKICNSGTFSKDGLNCLSCETGIAPNPGMSDCIPCGSHNVPDPLKIKCECAPGYGKKDDGSCKICPAGFFSLGGENTCEKCTESSVSHEGSEKCDLCVKPKIPNLLGSDCVDMCENPPVVQNADRNELDKCSGVPIGYTCKITCSDSVLVGSDPTCTSKNQYSNLPLCECLAGKESIDGKCVNCKSGTYSSKQGQACIPCPKDQIAGNEGMSHCEFCPENQLSSLDHKFCFCPPGFGLDDGGKCTKCKSGFISNQMNGTCTQCDLNSVTSDNHQSCIPCKKTFKPDFERLNCVCKNGYYASFKNKCNCSSGNDNNCVECLESCNICPIGTYSQGNLSLCKKCPENYVALKGSIECSFCDKKLSLKPKSDYSECECLKGMGHFNNSLGCQYCPQSYDLSNQKCLKREKEKEQFLGLSWWVWIVIGVGVLLAIFLLVFGCVLFFKHKKPPAPPPAEDDLILEDYTRASMDVETIIDF